MFDPCYVWGGGCLVHVLFCSSLCCHLAGEEYKNISLV